MLLLSKENGAGTAREDGLDCVSGWPRQGMSYVHLQQACKVVSWMGQLDYWGREHVCGPPRSWSVVRALQRTPVLPLLSLALNELGRPHSNRSSFWLTSDHEQLPSQPHDVSFGQPHTKAAAGWFKVANKVLQCCGFLKNCRPLTPSLSEARCLNGERCPKLWAANMSSVGGDGEATTTPNWKVSCAALAVGHQTALLISL
jgi:hypothetical protein